LLFIFILSLFLLIASQAEHKAAEKAQELGEKSVNIIECLSFIYSLRCQWRYLGCGASLWLRVGQADPRAVRVGWWSALSSTPHAHGKMVPVGVVEKGESPCRGPEGCGGVEGRE